MTAWIPVRFAVKGKTLRLIDDDGWRVIEVGSYLDKVEGQRGYFAGGVWRNW
jgi:hypothetical protein